MRARGAAFGRRVSTPSCLFRLSRVCVCLPRFALLALLAPLAWVGWLARLAVLLARLTGLTGLARFAQLGLIAPFALSLSLPLLLQYGFGTVTHGCHFCFLPPLPSCSLPWYILTTLTDFFSVGAVTVAGVSVAARLWL